MSASGVSFRAKQALRLETAIETVVTVPAILPSGSASEIRRRGLIVQKGTGNER